MNWLRKLFERCQHEWELLHHQTLREGGNKAVGDRFILRCKKCGDMTCRTFLA